VLGRTIPKLLPKLKATCDTSTIFTDCVGSAVRARGDFEENRSTQRVTTAMSKYSFYIPEFQIAQVRSQHTDTLWASTALKVLNANGSLHQDYGSESKSLGDRKAGGGVKLDLSWSNIDVPDPTPENPDGGSINWSFLLVNAGHTDLEVVQKMGDAAASIAGDLAKDALSLPISPAKVLEAVGAGLLFGVSKLLEGMTANCDGIVGTGAFQKTARELVQMTGPAKLWYTTDDNPGTDSPHGCGATNSDYKITYQIMAGTRIVQLFYRGNYQGNANSLLSRWRNFDGSWSDEQPLGAPLNGNPIPAMIPGTNILQLFYRGTDSSLRSRWRNPDGTWSGEQLLGGVINTDPFAAVVPDSGVLQLFYRGLENGLYSRWRDPNGNWSEEQPLLGVLNGRPVATVIPGTDILQVFYRGTDNSVYSQWRNPDGTWSNEQQIGGILNGDPIAVAIPGTELLQLFYRGTDNSIWSRWRNPDGSWSTEQQIGGILNGDPVAVVIPDTSIVQLFYRSADNTLRSRWRNDDGSWSDEQQLGGLLSGDPVVTVLPGTGTVQVFWRGSDNSVHSRWRNFDGGWSNEQSLGGVLNGDPIASVNPD
jgi:hypothetical protein